MKTDLAIYTHVLGVPGQYESVALMLRWISIVVPIGMVFANQVTNVIYVTLLKIEYKHNVEILPNDR